MEHYFSKKQESPFVIKKIKAKVFDSELEFNTAPGVFSKDKPDFGSLCLVRNSDVEGKVLDLGCGYGLIGISIAKKFKVDVVMSDVNKRALRLTKMNVKLNKVKAEVIESDLFSSIDGKFDTIICNPPQKAGKETCFKIISDSKKYLVFKGLLQIVARHNRGGKELMKKMEEVFGNVKETFKKAGFRVYVSKLN